VLGATRDVAVLFDIADVRRAGTIGATEFRAFLDMLAASGAASEGVRRAFREFELRPNGRLSGEAFSDFCARFPQLLLPLLDVQVRRCV
jgi:hypothetical protein